MALESLLMVWILTSSEAFLLRGPAGPLVAQLGGSVLLPCSAETPLPLEELEVEWRRTDSEALVHLFQEGEVRPESQSYDYSGRAHFLTEGFAAGNYSLLLTNVTRADGRDYICKVFTNLDSNEITAEIKDIERLVVTGTGVASAYVGDEVTLNCSVDSHIPPGELDNVTWKRKDQEMLVLVFRYDQIVPVSAHELYRDRADLFTAEIPKGNFSLRLKHVRPEDKGEYVCEAHSGHLSASTIIVLQGLGPPPVLILALVLCVIALLLALGLGVPSCIHLVSNGKDRIYTQYHSGHFEGTFLVTPF
ncbi:CD276 antigen-like [Clupea harengus]|uniref:CD276 antigen-like n=1 Tax=Clupea harengus TaxID=7950 RepID=A0A8M1KCE1_CLUHA|nr:CD276 antigen-like [Clupea harengus]